ncbi:CdaR family protein [Aquimarina agarilytica]|uniref:CdaR family protein n=1 Tax=Aquimarina agarilytica TaxID=1087449 RepID=UPI000287AC05|nr:CdaR family protein [Aquimarina agarilytica]
MDNKEKKEANKKHKNYRTYFIFLGFTAFLWFSLQFSKNYSQEVTFNINYKQLQNQKAVKPSSDKEVKMVLNGSGLQLLKYTFFNHSIDLDARKADNTNDSHAFFTGKRMHDILKSSLGYEGEISHVFKDTLHVYYDVYEDKKIPLKINSTINYASGYTSIKGVTSEDKEILVTGPKSVLDTLKFIATDVLKLDDIKTDYQGILTISKNKLPENLKFEKKEINIDLIVDKLTEGEFQVPITLLNVPKNVRVQLFPKQVGVVFSVTLKDYPKLTALDFSITANMIKAEPNTTSLLLKLDKIPNFVYNARLMKKEVQYVVIK